MKSDNPIEHALGLRAVDKSVSEPEAVEPGTGGLELVEETKTDLVAVDADMDPTVADIELARSNIKNIIQEGNDSLREMIDLAKQSESPRAFEVASGLMKTLLDANKDFVEMSMKKKYAREEILNPREEQTTNVTNNNLILSTADLLAMIKGEAK